MADTKRPPPLALKIDNTLPGYGIKPPATARPLATRVYEANWRNLVITATALNVLRYLLNAGTAWHDEDIDNQAHFPGLAKMSTLQGYLYTTACGIEMFGMLTVLSRRPILLRIYIHFAFITALLVTVAGVFIAASFFVYADDLIGACVLLASSNQLDELSAFRGDAWKTEISKAHGKHHAACHRVWENESWAQIIYAFLFYLLPCTISYLIVYTYYRQTLDPGHPAYLSRRPGAAMRMGPIGNGYAAVPQGDREDGDERNGKGKGKGKGKQRASKPTGRSPNEGASTARAGPSFLAPGMSPYGMTPGPPSFSNRRGYDYQVPGPLSS